MLGSDVDGGVPSHRENTGRGGQCREGKTKIIRVGYAEFEVPMGHVSGDV